MFIYIVVESEMDDRNNEYQNIIEVFYTEALAMAFIKLQDYPTSYSFEVYEIHDSITKFSEAYTKKLQVSAYNKLSPAERIAVGILITP